MGSMGQHDIHEAAGRPLRRAGVAAWAVFLGMAGTSMTFQVYHAVTRGHMPWPLAVLYGVVPLGVSIGVLEVAAAWQSKTAKGAAWLVTGGAMYLSAFATGAVSASAAPSHAELLFGAVLDGAALIAARFILDGPRAAQAVAEVAARIAELAGERDRAVAARAEAEANAARTLQAARAEHEAALAGERQAHEKANAALSGQLAEANETARREAAVRLEKERLLVSAETELAAVRTARDVAEDGRQHADTARSDEADRAERQVAALRQQLDQARAAAARVRTVEAERDDAFARLGTAEAERDGALAAREEAERSAAKANAKAERLARTAGAQESPKAARSARTQAAPAERTEGQLTPAQAREKAYEKLDGNPDLTGAELGELFGFGERWGQKRKEEYERRNGLRAVGEN